MNEKRWDFDKFPSHIFGPYGYFMKIFWGFFLLNKSHSLLSKKVLAFKKINLCNVKRNCFLWKILLMETYFHLVVTHFHIRINEVRLLTIRGKICARMSEQQSECCRCVVSHTRRLNFCRTVIMQVFSESIAFYLFHFRKNPGDNH